MSDLVADRPYYPSRGMNLDSNGIIVRPEEAIDCLNMNIAGSEVRPRFGTIVLDPHIKGITYPTEAILHYHEYLEPEGNVILFGFTNKDIYKYTAGIGWSSIINSSLIGGKRFNQWCTTDFIDLEYGATVVACGSRYREPDQAESQGANRILLFYNKTSGEFEKLSINSNFPITDENTGEIAPYATTPQRFIDNILFKAIEYDKWTVGTGGAGYTAIAIDFNDDLSSDPPTLTINMYSDDLTIKTPTSDLAEARAVEITINYKAATVETTTIVELINAHNLASQIILAVGISSVNPADTSGFVELYDGSSGIVSGTLDHSTSLDLGFVKITPGQFYIKTEYGTIASCGSEVHNIGGKDAYRLLPVDNTLVEYGDRSYVYVDGSGFQIAFITDLYGGEQLYADYYYEKTESYYPKVVQVFHNALVFGNTYEDSVYYPWRLRWTLPGDMTITNDDNYLDLVISNTSGIRAIRLMETESNSSLGNYIYVYKDRSVERGTYDPNVFLDFDTALHSGVYAPRTIENVEGIQIFLGSNDVYAFDGIRTVSLTYDAEMQTTRVKEFLLDIMDPIILNNTFAVYDKYRRKYMLFIKKRNELYPTNVLVYDMDRKFWVRYKLPETSAAIHLSLNLSFNTIDSLVGTIDELKGTINSLGGYTTNQVSIFAMTSKSYVAVDSASYDKMSSVEDTQVVKTHSLITRDFLFKTLEEAERISMMKFEAYGSSVNVRYSTEYDTEPQNFIAITNHEVFPLTINFKTYYYNLDTQADKVRFLFTSTSDFKLRWMQVFSIPTTEITEE